MPSPDDKPTTDPYTGQDMRLGGDKPTLHDVVTGTEAGQTAAQAALDASMEVQRAVSGASSPRAILVKLWENGVNQELPDYYSDTLTVDEALAAIAAYYEGLVPEKRKIATRDGFTGYGTPKLGVDLEAVGFNAAIDTIRRNFKGQGDAPDHSEPSGP